MDKKSKVYLIIIGIFLVMIIFGNIVIKKVSFNNKKFNNYIKTNEFVKSDDIYIGNDDSFKSFDSNETFNSFISINTKEKQIQGTLDSEFESVEIIYNLFDNYISIVYENYSHEDAIIDKFEGNYAKNTYNCETLSSDSSVSYCDKLKPFADDFKEYYDKLTRK